MTDTKLLPCPFCGGEAECIELTDDDNFGGSTIQCMKCQASSAVHFDRKENLYDWWNRRPSPPTAGDEPSSWEDREDDLSAAILASHPVNSKRYDTYARAMELVSNRHSKGALVNLVNHLLIEAAALHPAPAVEGWQPIETAPKDGTPIITCVVGFEPAIGVRWVEFEGEARFSEDPETFMQEEHFREYFHGTSYKPTHWMPLPPAPGSSAPPPPQDGGEVERAKEVDNLLSDGLEILINMIESVQRHGNYTPESTVVYLDQARGAIGAARAALRDGGE